MGTGGQAGQAFGQSGNAATPGFSLNQIGQSLSKLGGLMPQLTGGGKMPIMTNMPQVNVGPNSTPVGMNGANPMMSMMPQQRSVSPVFSNVANQASSMAMGNVSGAPIAGGMSGRPLTQVVQPRFNTALASAPIPQVPQMPQMSRPAVQAQSPASNANPWTSYAIKDSNSKFQYNSTTGEMQQQNPDGTWTTLTGTRVQDGKWQSQVPGGSWVNWLSQPQALGN